MAENRNILLLHETKRHRMQGRRWWERGRERGKGKEREGKGKGTWGGGKSALKSMK
jgi:hypothetical protein